MKISTPPEHFNSNEVAEFYANLINSLSYPVKPTAPRRDEFGSHESYGRALDQYEQGMMKEWRESVSQYREQVSEIEQAFKKELLKRLGLSKHPKADKLYSMAWDRGHSSGFYEVVTIAEGLSELLLD